MDETSTKETNPQANTKRSGAGPFVLVVIALAVVGWVVFALTNANSTPTESNEKPLNLLVGRDSTGITIENKTDEEVTGCRMTVNGDYQYGAFNISESGTVPYAEITKRDGERFNILSTSVKSIVIDCDGYEVMEYS